MPQESLHWTSTDHTEIYAYQWPVDRPKGIVAIVHGLGEHIHRYEAVAQLLNASGFTVIGHDHRGHGRSGGTRGHSPSLQALLEDVEELTRQARSRFGEQPLFLYGQSMGGNLVLQVLRYREKEIHPDGVISSSPWIALTQKPSAIKVGVGKLIARLLPTLTIPNDLDASHISRVPEQVTAYKEDPMVHSKISTGLGAIMLEGAEELNQTQLQTTTPLLLMHGEGDKITDPRATAAFSARANGPVSYRAWPEAYHELHNEYIRKDVVDYTIGWMEGVLAAQDIRKGE